MIFACFSIPPSDPGRAGSHWSIWDLMTRSIRKIHSADSKILLLTGFGVEIPPAVDQDCILRLTAILDVERLMLAELECWSAFAASDDFAQPTVFIDHDILVQRDVSEIFDQSFDVGVTWRPRGGSPHPINAGVLFLDPSRRDRVRDFFYRLLSCAQSLPTEFWRWYGDQEALEKVLGAGHFRRDKPPRRIKVGSTTIRPFPAQQFNYSATYGSEHLHAPEPHIVHFKGKRKAAMAQYAGEFLDLR